MQKLALYNTGVYVSIATNLVTIITARVVIWYLHDQ